MIAALFIVVASGGGWIIGMIMYLILISIKGSGKNETTGIKSKINLSDTYHLIDLSKGKIVVATSNDYQQAFKLKQLYGVGVVIKNNGPFVSNLRKM